ncbi:hypothetical protein LTS08_000013 [Lithohypha guttulata]|uniref:Uncharacterized protein n=2 Tax=Lithohypha guttulata TaxID=1690604 RepID=A0ABR0JXF4_9EURO|nr:hypothetical protein LTR24_009277 [Lithohypha guttulata]KAK5080337.1 hypothetical protein LTR05_008697 [Lithohypha guttulata]KAK5105899.1 hypothetical protein LTS08_000013 [Lithohypha guttulata]KAK5310495.1 hypothetical protein LTR70_009441 [Exophiala xenobiotica]
MPKNTKTSGWLINELKIQKDTFDDTTYPLPSYQLTKFESCIQLLQESTKSLSHRSSPQSGRRTRVRVLLKDIFLALNSEVFLLCTLAASITTLADVAQQGLIRDLGNWWKETAHPQGLSGIGSKLCDTFSVSTLFGSAPSCAGYDQRKAKLHDHQQDAQAPEAHGVVDGFPDNADARLNLEESSAPAYHVRDELVKAVPTNRHIEYRYSEAPINQMILLSDLISDAVQSSHQWKWERDLGGKMSTDCVNALVPKSRTQDISITLLVGYEKGMKLIEELQLELCKFDSGS